MEGDGLHAEVINDDLEFCIWDMSRQGGLLVVLIFD